MDIRQKIAAILAKAASTNMPAEAATFVAKAQRLMEEHQIEAHELGGTDDPIGRDFGPDWNAKQTSLKEQVRHSLARYYGCRVVREYVFKDLKPRHKLAIIGPESARVTTEMMVDYVYKALRAEGNRLAKEGVLGGSAEKNIIRVINAFRIRIQQEVASREKSAPTASGKFALVLLDQVDAYVDDLYPDLYIRAGRRISSGDGQHRAAAASVSLHRQAGGTATLRIGN